MILLPDAYIGDEPLSLQAPFTFCGSLILKIEKEHAPYGYSDADVDIITFYYFYPKQYIFECFSLPSIWIAKEFYSAIQKYNKNQDKGKGPVLTYEYDKWLADIKKQEQLFDGIDFRSISISEPYLDLVKQLVDQRRAEAYLSDTVYQYATKMSQKNFANFCYAKKRNSVFNFQQIIYQRQEKNSR